MKKLLLALLATICMFACKDLKEAQNDISDIKNNITDIVGRLDTIEEQLTALQEAYDDGKIIKDVKSFTDGDLTGWEIMFSDNSSIRVYDGADAVTPILNINQRLYWEVSYDDGVTFTPILGADGQPIMSKGEKGNEGLSLRVVVSESGMYVIESFYASASDTVIESILTPYSSSPASAISSIIKDQLTEIITLVMADGSEYKFNLDVLYPTGIVVLAESLPLASEGTSSFMFRVNPSNAVVKLDLDAENL